jgi:hypothetical protein
VPDWITAVSTLGAFLAALTAAVLASIVYWHDRGARRAEQANRVAAWVEWPGSLGNLRLYQDSTDLYPAYEPLEADAPDQLGHACILLNTSPLPVYEVVLDYSLYEVGGRPAGSTMDSVPLLPPGKHVLRLPPGATATAERGGMIRVAIMFKDTANRMWHREVDGHLVERHPERDPRPTVRPEDLVAHVTRCRPTT